MSTILRFAARGSLFGWALTALILLVLPRFFAHAYELILAPVVLGAVGSVIGLVVFLSGRRSPSVHGFRVAVIKMIAIAVCLGLFAIRSGARNFKVAPEMIMFCIDGGTWDIIDPLIFDGRMPTLESLKASGTSAVLMSTEPSWSMIAWSTLGTGVPPEKHGVTSFYSTQDHLRSKRVWEIYEDLGHSVGLFRYWITWPPRFRNGFVVPDILARDGEAFPPSLNYVNRFRIDIRSDTPVTTGYLLGMTWHFLRGGVRLKTWLNIAQTVLPARRSGRYADYHIAMRRAEIQLNTDLYMNLIRTYDPEYTCFYDNGADQMCHFYWQYFEPEKFDDVDPDEVARYGSTIPDYYALHDRMIGEIMRHVDDASTVVVVSDHGFAADSAGTANWYFPRGVQIVNDMQMADAYYSIALGSPVFIESVKTDSTAKQAALETALERLAGLTVEETGVPLFAPWIEDEFRIQLDVNKELTDLDGHVSTPSGDIPLSSWFTTRVYGGTHHPAGIFLGSRGPFQSGHRGQTAQLVDVAPTLLYATGFPISRDFDGRVMTEWMEGAYLTSTPVDTVDTYGGYDGTTRDLNVDKETLEKLRSLGYVR